MDCLWDPKDWVGKHCPKLLTAAQIQSGNSHGALGQITNNNILAKRGRLLGT